MLRLNVGAGNTHLEGWISIDCRSETNPDKVAFAHELPYSDCSADEILVAHTLEHVSHGINFDHPEKIFHPNVLDVLKEFYQVLKSGGRLEVRTPNLVAIVDYLYDEQNIRVFNMAILGGQENPEDYHRSAFNWRFLRELLEEAGFTRIRRIIDCQEDNGKHPANLVVECFK